MFAQSFSRSGRLGKVERIGSTNCAFDETDVVASMDATGGAVIAWNSGNSERALVRTRSSTGALGPVQRLANGYVSDVATGSDGTATFLLTSEAATSALVVQRVDSGGVVELPVQIPIAPNVSFSAAGIAVDDVGNTVAAWDQTSAYRDGPKPQLWAERLHGSGVQGKAIAISPPNGVGGDAGLTVTPGGTATLMWQQHSSSGGFIPEERSVTTGDVLGPIRKLATRQEYATPEASAPDVPPNLRTSLVGLSLDPPMRA